MIRPGFPWGGVLLIVVGVWLALNMVAGDLTGRILSWAAR